MFAKLKKRIALSVALRKRRKQQLRVSLLRRMAHYFFNFGQRPAAIGGLFVLSFSEAILSPLPGDPFLFFLSLRAKNKIIWFFFSSLIGSLLGLLLSYSLSFYYYPSLLYQVLELYQIRDLFFDLHRILDYHGYEPFIFAAFLMVPFHFYGLTAGVLAAEQGSLIDNPIFWPMVIGALAGRILHYLCILFLPYFWGARIYEFINHYLEAIFVMISISAVLGYFLFRIPIFSYLI